MTHHITDEQILTEAQSRMGASAVERIGTSAVIGTVRAVLALAAPQGEPMTDTERADMICAVAAICTGTSSRNLAATAIEWTERRYGITALAAPAPAVPSVWKLVPVEPTDAMVQAAHHIDLSYMPGQEGADRAAVYRAMLSASPAAKEGGGNV